MPHSSDAPSLLGWLLYRFFHTPRNALRNRNAEFLLYLLAGRRVLGGPFRGLRYVGSSPNTHIGDALLGTLELEIRPFIERLRAGLFDVFINVGAAEGYYAVGMAKFSRIPWIIAFEGDRLGRTLIRFMAQRNGVSDRIDVRGFCTPTLLADALISWRSPALLIDIEGAEEQVLDPTVNPHLSRSTIIVELHEMSRSMADLLRPRFSATHRIEEIWSRPRTFADLPANLGAAGPIFSPERLLRFADERRGRPMRWWLLTPRSKT
ncbi:MAG: hypothetical protein PHQ04_07135 [Opitutaceae bacterium]|nr:hypothetical protein [Opitutaceae bacterium]